MQPIAMNVCHRHTLKFKYVKRMIANHSEFTIITLLFWFFVFCLFVFTIFKYSASALIGGGTSTAAAKNQLEQLTTMREALFSQDGWGCQHVNQDTNWDVPGSPEPMNPGNIVKSDPTQAVAAGGGSMPPWSKLF